MPTQHHHIYSELLLPVDIVAVVSLCVNCVYHWSHKKLDYSQEVRVRQTKIVNLQCQEKSDQARIIHIADSL